LARIELVIDEQQSRDDEPWVQLETRAGAQWQQHVPVPSGAPTNPLTHDALLAKYRSLAARILPLEQVERLEAVCLELDEVADVGEMVGLLAQG
jgi:2-methylcitrate dehydratase PrpD